MPSHRDTAVIIATFLMLWGGQSGQARKEKEVHRCPIGFKLAYTPQEKPICYKRKEKEAFGDIFTNCAGNLYTSELYHSLNISKDTSTLWSGHKSMYPGGPFVDWSYSPTTGQLLTTTYDVNYNSALGLSEELCVIIDPTKNFTAANCSEKHRRYCMVEPYDDNLSKCEELEGSTDYYRFWSPRATCLSPVVVKSLRANFKQAQILCERRNGTLLNRGWRYANNPLLHPNKTDWYNPLGIEKTSETELRWINKEDGLDEVPESEWELESIDDFTDENSVLSLHAGSWSPVSNAYIFMDVICERSIHLRDVNMSITVKGNEVLLHVSEYLNPSDINCFTDALLYSPSTIDIARIDEFTYSLKTKSDGFYWCIHRDSKNFRVAESNKALFVQERNVRNLYAVKLRLSNKYRLEEITTKSYKVWKEKLETYIYYTTKYIESGKNLTTEKPHEIESVLHKFRSSVEGSDESIKDADVIMLLKIKRLYLDRQTVLLHVHLNPKMKIVWHGFWQGMEVYMKPAYFCTGTSRRTNRVPLGKSVVSNCTRYSCVGDFNEGVSFVMTDIANCSAAVTREVTNITVDMPTVPVPTALPVTTPANRDELENNRDVSLEGNKGAPTTPCSDETTEVTTEVTTDSWEVSTVSNEVSTVDTVPEEITTVHPWLPPRPPLTTEPPTTNSPTTTRPTTTDRPLAPEEQLQQVIQNINDTIHNDSIPILVETVSEYVGQVDQLLEVEEELDFPGELLHLVDELAARVNLNGSQMGRAIGKNIAMLMADASPDNPVTGLRIAAQDADSTFTDENFQIIHEEVNNTHLTSENSEAVVHLPDSVTNSSRRISFVVFRNDRAFMSTDGLYSVNSRVLSIKIQELTEFADGEVIDIHLRPLASEPDRNQSRTCAYWHFLEDDTGSGYWSQEGCTFIASSTPGQLDTCRCDHLTHFAEVLVPRSVFSERNESVLEVISIVGCVLSILGLVLVGFTAFMFRSWRRDFSNKIWLQLCISIFILITCFLVVVFVQFDPTAVSCLLVGVLLHYSVLASFSWMLVAAVLSYRRLVLVFTRDASHKLLRASAFAWGAPCAVVGILLSVNPHSYSERFEEKSPSGSFCYPSGLCLWLTVYAPIAIMLLANWTLFVLIVRSVFASKGIQRHGDSNEALRCASVSCLLVFLFGLPWIFGLFSYNIVAAYLFTLTGTLQGFVLFIFFVLGNKKTRDLWLNKLKIKQTQKVPVTSSTYTNNKSQNSHSDWRGGRPGPATIEANASKPRSLSSPDETRFS